MLNGQVPIRHQFISGLGARTCFNDGTDSVARGGSRNMYAAQARAALQQLDQGDDQAALGDQRAEQPSQKIHLHRLDAGRGFLLQGVDVGLDGGDIRLGGEVGIIRRATCSSARVSACFSVKPLSVRRLTKRRVSKAVAAVMLRSGGLSISCIHLVRKYVVLVPRHPPSPFSYDHSSPSATVPVGHGLVEVKFGYRM